VFDVTMGAYFRPFCPVYLTLGTNPAGHILGSCFLESRPKSTSLEPFNCFIKYLELKSWLKKIIFDKNKKVTKRYDLIYQVKFSPAVTRQQIELESCSNPRKTRDVL